LSDVRSGCQHPGTSGVFPLGLRGPGGATSALMDKANQTRLAWNSFAVAAALGAAALVFLALSWREPEAPGSFGFRGFTLLFVIVFGVVGALIASRRPENPIGWLFLASAVLSGAQELAQDYAYF